MHNYNEFDILAVEVHSERNQMNRLMNGSGGNISVFMCTLL